MKNLMALFATAITFLFLNSTAHAEEFLLHQHKNWEVRYIVTNQGYEYCSASVGDADLALNIDADPVTGVSVWVIDSARNWVESTSVRTIAYIDRLDPWIIDRTNTNGNLAWFNIDGAKGALFLQEIAAGKRLYFDYNEEGTSSYVWDVWFSLDGSTAAIIALSDCLSKISRPRV